MFQFKTKGNVSPQGKRRVYFTCHPDDYDRFFEKISSEILKFSDCAIWYNPDDNYENIDTDLGQMNLFVIPITTKLLTKPCRTMEQDVPFALEKHIPILPLMQEGRLDELFTRHFGDLQYLDPNKHDITAISYEDKLKKYLNSVLVSDEMAEKVRAAFDAYIFLSYRKKDRKYAKELMRLIHKNDFCRDIAIWYDEYLVPGEDFNNAITEALKKSDLFAMLVTPNLVNETNYVQTVEYPEAVKQNKTIIPTELEKTDYKVLSEKYPNIPNSVDAHDKVALSGVLHSALLQIAKRENDNDPEHNFFIGLAYLDGIDVEKNHERALKLITSAAETNEVPEAIEKLVMMYHDGYGVKRDYRVAVQWQQKLVEYWEKRFFSESKDRDDIFECNKSEEYRYLQNSLLNLARQLCDLDFTLAENIYIKIEEISSHFDIDNNIFEQMIFHGFDNYLCDSYISRGAIQLDRKNLDEAEKLFNKSLELLLSTRIYKAYIKYIETGLSHFTGFTDEEKFWHSLWWCYSFLGRVQMLKGNLNCAEKIYLKTLELYDRLERISNYRFLHYISETYLHLGEIKEVQGELYYAEKNYRKGLELTEIWTKQNSYFDCNFFAGKYMHIGEIQRKIDNLYAAESFYRKALELYEKMSEEDNSLYYRKQILIIYGILGEIQIVQGNLNSAGESYCKAFELGKKIAKESNSYDFLYNLLNSYFNLGKIRELQGNLYESEEFFRKALELALELNEKNEKVNISFYDNLLNIYFKLGNIQKSLGKLDKAESFYKKALELNEVTIMEEPNSVFDFEYTTDIYLILGDIQNTLGNLGKAEFFYRKALKLNEKIAKESNSKYFLKNLSNVYEKLGNIQKTQCKLTEADLSFNEALEIRREFDIYNLTESALSMNEWGTNKKDDEVLENELIKLYGQDWYDQLKKYAMDDNNQSS